MKSTSPIANQKRTIPHWKLENKNIPPYVQLKYCEHKAFERFFLFTHNTDLIGDMEVSPTTIRKFTPTGNYRKNVPACV